MVITIIDPIEKFISLKVQLTKKKRPFNSLTKDRYTPPHSSQVLFFLDFSDLLETQIPHKNPLPSSSSLLSSYFGIVNLGLLGLSGVSLIGFLSKCLSILEVLFLFKGLLEFVFPGVAETLAIGDLVLNCEEALIPVTSKGDFATKVLEERAIYEPLPRRESLFAIKLALPSGVVVSSST